MAQLTVKDLFVRCQEQIAHGNGDKHIVISDDNEGNGYHGLTYGFTEIEAGEEEEYPIYDSQFKKAEDIIILG